MKLVKLGNLLSRIPQKTNKHQTINYKSFLEHDRTIEDQKEITTDLFSARYNIVMHPNDWTEEGPVSGLRGAFRSSCPS